MTVSTATSSAVYTGTGTTATYAYSWGIAQSTDLIAYTIDATGSTVTKLVNGVDYTVTGAGIPTGGTIVLTAGNLANGVRVFLCSDPVQVQQLLLSQGAAFNPADAMAALDLLTREVQATRRIANAALQIPTAESLDGYALTLPTKAQRASKLVGFDANGNAIASGGTGGITISGSMTPVVQAASLGAARTAMGGVAIAIGSIALLKALGTTDLVGDVLVEAYATAGDGGGGIYRWNNSDSTADNGGTVIQPNSAPTTGRWNLVHNGTVSVKQFGAVGDGVVNDTAATQAILNAGIKSIVCPPGTYLVDLITFPAARGIRIVGSGFDLYNTAACTTFKARTNGNAAIFTMPSGCDCVELRSLCLDAANLAQKCINHAAADLNLEHVGFFNSTQYGIYANSICNFRHIYGSGHAAQGVSVFSDGTFDRCEVTGGTIPFEVRAGGNEIRGCLLNAGTTVAGLQIKPQDVSTTLINTRVIGCYMGEGVNGSSIPVVNIAGNASQKVQQTMIVGCHFTHATVGLNINGFIRADTATDLTVTGCTFRGQDTSGQSTRYTDYALYASSVDVVTFTGNTARGVNLNAVKLTSVPGFTITANTFQDCGSTYATSTQGANVYVTDSGSNGVVTGNHFYVSNGSTVTYAVQAQADTQVAFEDNFINYAGSTIVALTSGTWIGGYQRSGSAPARGRNPASQNYTQRGQFAAGAGATTNNVVTLPTAATNKSYLFMFMQSGTGANATIGAVFLYNTTGGAITLGNTNTATLVNTVQMSGATVQFVQGSGYGATTWDWTMIEIG